MIRPKTKPPSALQKDSHIFFARRWGKNYFKNRLLKKRLIMIQNPLYYMTFSFRRWFAGLLVDSKLSSTFKKIEKRYATSDEAQHMLSAWKLDYLRADVYRFSQRFPKQNLQLEVNDTTSRDPEYIEKWHFEKIRARINSKLTSALLKGIIISQK